MCDARDSTGCPVRPELRRDPSRIVSGAGTLPRAPASMICERLALVTAPLPPASARGSSRRGPPRYAESGLRSKRRGEGVIAASRAACSAESCAAGDAEVALRRGLGAEDAVAPLDHVEVELEDALLRQHRLQQHGDHRLLRLAHVALLGRQEQVLRELLRDRRAARHDAALFLVLLERFLDAVPVEPRVLDEFRVLGGDHRALELRRDPRVGHPRVAQGRRRIPASRFVHALRHEGGLARRVVAVPRDVRRDPREPDERDREERRDDAQRPA